MPAPAYPPPMALACILPFVHSSAPAYPSLPPPTHHPGLLLNYAVNGRAEFTTHWSAGGIRLNALTGEARLVDGQLQTLIYSHGALMVRGFRCEGGPAVRCQPSALAPCVPRVLCARCRSSATDAVLADCASAAGSEQRARSLHDA